MPLMWSVDSFSSRFDQQQHMETPKPKKTRCTRETNSPFGGSRHLSTSAVPSSISPLIVRSEDQIPQFWPHDLISGVENGYSEHVLQKGSGRPCNGITLDMRRFKRKSLKRRGGSKSEVSL